MMQSLVPGLLSGAELFGLLLAMPLMALHSQITEGVMEKVRLWHGKIDELDAKKKDLNPNT
jgi:hypothetical protein